MRYLTNQVVNTTYFFIGMGMDTNWRSSSVSRKPLSVRFPTKYVDEKFHRVGCLLGY